MVEKVRASREGHQFHEAWTARRALELLLPRDGLIGIAVEGLSPADQGRASKDAAEIADLSLYYGKGARFEDCSRQEILQFKYSVAYHNAPFAASDAKKTIRKFAATERDYIQRFGAEAVQAKLRYEIVTNRPINTAFASALAALANGRNPRDARIASQVRQISAASSLKGADLQNFARRAVATGTVGSLKQLKGQVSRKLADWSVTNDALARARLGALCDLVREKAETKGEGRNVITLVDVLDALEIQDERDLLPAPESFPEIGPVVARPQLKAVLDLLTTLKSPLLVHAAGGIGKTVFLQSIATSVSVADEVVLFDCFGGGNYRSEDDSRHLPKRGLLHIINLLATRGLCDPVLPCYGDVPDLFRTARRRFGQAVATLRQFDPRARLLILLDAADNAAKQARDRNEDSFPRLLLESFAVSGPPDGVVLIASCRTENRDLAQGKAGAEQFPLHPFGIDETRAYAEARIPGATPSEINVAQARSQGNPRVLSHLVDSWEELVRSPETLRPLVVDELIEMRLTKALGTARKQGYAEADIATFLAGLTVLPPPVPISEYARAVGIDPAAVESFAADLAPLLDRTSLGLVFRDEPTETVVRRQYGGSRETLLRVAGRLEAAQAVSLYAARSLPHLLRLLGEAKRALELAFSDQLPASVTSEVGKRSLRVARLTVAVGMAANAGASDDLVRLLVELGSLVTVSSRADDYISANPDLVVDVGDGEALRRLFELRTMWPGARHARLGIANVLAGNAPEATRHVRRTHEWLRWYFEQKEDPNIKRELGPSEVVAIPLYLVSQERSRDAIRELGRWRNWFGYLVSTRLCDLVSGLPREQVRAFVQALSKSSAKVPAIYAAALEGIAGISRHEFAATLDRLAKACRGQKPESNSLPTSEEFLEFNSALVFSAALAVRHGKLTEAREILRAAHLDRPGQYIFGGDWYADHIANWVLQATTLAVACGRQPQLEDLVPKECAELLSGRRFGSTEAAIAAIEHAIAEAKAARAKRKKPESSANLSELLEVLKKRVVPLLHLSKVLARVIKPRRAPGVDVSTLIDIWKQLRANSESYRDSPKTLRDFDTVGREVVFWALRLSGEFNAKIVTAFVGAIRTGHWPSNARAVSYIKAFARHASTAELAGAMAAEVEQQIDKNDDVVTRGKLFALIARALRPASREDSAHYFRLGLKQLDAIGSSDYEVIQELLALASKFKGSELTGEQSQRLFNLCELNFLDEPGKFPWALFGGAVSVAIGPKALAQLGRWDDRERVSLDYTLPATLAALLKAKRVEPFSALSLLMLDDPVEYWDWSLSEFVAALLGASNGSPEPLAQEVLRQVELSSPQGSTSSTLKGLADALQGRLAPTSIVLKRLAELQPIAERGRAEDNARSESRSGSLLRDSGDWKKREQAGLEKLDKLASGTDPCDSIAIDQALTELENVDGVWNHQVIFLDKLRHKVSYANRLRHVDALVAAQKVRLSTRLEALQKCVDDWSGNSGGIKDRRRELAEKLILLCVEELTSRNYGFGSSLRDLSKLTQRAESELAILVIQALSDRHLEIGPVIWFRLAYLVAEAANPSAVKLALTRILDSEAARLANDIGDGIFRPALDPRDNQSTLVAGLVWLRLGAPDAVLRWRAAHSVRLLARFERWTELDKLVELFPRTDAGAFGGTGVKFFYLHARLWFLIGMARACLADPTGMRRYQSFLEKVCFETHEPHVLVREFASQGLRALVDADASGDAARLRDRLLTVNVSLLPTTTYAPSYGDAWRPKDAPGPEPKFHLDYEFQKNDLNLLGSIFGLAGWQVGDMISEQVGRWAPDAGSMFDRGGRTDRHRDYGVEGAGSRFQTYGQQLGWHALMVVAGNLLTERGLSTDRWTTDPWSDWLHNEFLTRIDGCWLADGTDTYPLDVRRNLLEQRESGIDLPVALEKIIVLAGLDMNSGIGEEFVVSGSWKSRDDVDVSISSAFITSRGSVRACRDVAKSDPFSQWLPTLRGYNEGEEERENDQSPFMAWITVSDMEVRLDEYDSFGSGSAGTRARPSQDLIASTGLRTSDPFQHTWVDTSGQTIFRSEAWGSRRGYGRHEKLDSAQRLLCRKSFLLHQLELRKAKLAILVKLRFYQEEHQSSGKFTHSGVIALLSANGALQLIPTKRESRRTKAATRISKSARRAKTKRE